MQDSAVASVSSCSFRRLTTASAPVFIFIIPDLGLFRVGNRAGDQALHVQLLLLGLDLRENRLCLRMLGRKDGAAVLIRENGGIQRPDTAGDGNDLPLSMPMSGWKIGIWTTAPVTAMASMVWDAT